MPRKKKAQTEIILPDKLFTEILVELEIERIAGGEPGVSINEQGEPVEPKFQNNVFRLKEDGNRVLFEEKHVKGLLKETARILGLSKSVKGLLFKLRHALSMVPTEIYIPAGTEVYGRPIPVLLGDRVSITFTEVIEKPIKVSFKLRIPNTVVEEGGQLKAVPVIDPELLRKLFEVGQNVGIGAKRSLGYGKYKLLKFEVV